jgi:hypothetical protein
MRKIVWIIMIAAAIGTCPGLAQSQFQATLDPVQIVPTGGTDPAGVSGFTGSATATFQDSGPGGPSLSYSLFLPGMDLDGNRTPGVFSDDVTAIHLHFGAPGANGAHGLNIFGISGGQIRQDDAEMTFSSANATVSGRWNDSDQLFTGVGGLRQPFDSVALSGATNDLMAGELYFQVHSVNFPVGELRGQLVPVPEPAALLLFGVGTAVFAGMRRRSRASTNT